MGVWGKKASTSKILSSLLWTVSKRRRKVWSEWKLLPGCHLWCVMDGSLNGCFPSESRRLPASPRSLTAPGTAQVAKQAFYSRDSCLSRPSRSVSAALCAAGSEARSLCEETNRKNSSQCSNATINSNEPQTQRCRSLQFVIRTRSRSCCGHVKIVTLFSWKRSLNVSSEMMMKWTG